MTTAIISALPEEQAGLLQLLSNHEHLAQISRRLELGLIHKKPVILALAGVGKVAAATTATMLIERHQVQRIIFTGVAGAVATHIQVGDVVLGSSYLQHDMDASPLFPRFEVPYTGISKFEGNAELITIILEALRAINTPANSPKPFKIHEGLIISGDRFVSSASEVQTLRNDLPDALCVEMEGAAIAQVCHDYRIPFAAVRSISDKADDNAHVDFPSFVREVAGPLAVQLMDRLMRQL
ncbi:5'-methylthioadenosine/adenosylhomocysteine nucleosidase [Variovorax sp. PCZ-1]|uniref:5'-methylthioadenosine/adenosylhomocysteine nucleosidase n=1 Tax=Variovorax sp. PCZ-1 TaxID=2835533 RepID=UPI001BCD8A8C|nr:5'-methylthioadenosine/adenosylhomocysteine nucleosidase [Variovorax sp. PCZ-1]MBS7808659.1 5'-methylthioadenosine/adenosylhomocysteine nucleosidase [Variovorax sp. PCZ-1]